jgi:hypothetical protein
MQYGQGFFTRSVRPAFASPQLGFYNLLTHSIPSPKTPTVSIRLGQAYRVTLPLSTPPVDPLQSSRFIGPSIRSLSHLPVVSGDPIRALVGISSRYLTQESAIRSIAMTRRIGALTRFGLSVRRFLPFLRRRLGSESLLTPLFNQVARRFWLFLRAKSRRLYRR